MSVASPPQGGAPLLELRDVEKGFFGVPVLKGVSLSLGGGRVLGLVGENGAGKSTLLNVLGGVLAPEKDSKRLDGARYAPASPSDATARGIAFVHQELNLFPNLSVAENVFLHALPRRGPLVDRPRLEERTRALLERVGLGRRGQFHEADPLDHPVVPDVDPSGRLQDGHRRLDRRRRAPLQALRVDRPAGDPRTLDPAVEGLRRGQIAAAQVVQLAQDELVGEVGVEVPVRRAHVIQSLLVEVLQERRFEVQVNAAVLPELLQLLGRAPGPQELQGLEGFLADPVGPDSAP